MYPTICKIGPFTIYSYGVALIAAFSAGFVLASLRARKENISSDIIFNLSYLALFAGVIGARLFYVIENISYYAKYPLEIIMLQHGGLSWFGGLLLGSICGIRYLKKKKQPVYKVLDLMAPFLALAGGIGRIGCFLNGCCFGKAGIPIQIYSSLALIFIFIVLRLLQDRLHKEGEIFFAYLLLYSLKRFLIEFWRADNPVIFGGLTLFQLISVAIFFASLAKLIKIKSKVKP